MIRYQLVSVDPCVQEDARLLEGTYPREVAEAIVQAAYQDPEYTRILQARPVSIRLRRHTYYVEAAGRRWHIVADSPQQALRDASRRGSPTKVWYCKDDFTAGSSPLLVLCREAG